MIWIIHLLVFIVIPFFIIKQKNIFSVGTFTVLSFAIVYFLPFYTLRDKLWIHDDWFVFTIVLSFLVFIGCLKYYHEKGKKTEEINFLKFDESKIKWVQAIVGLGYIIMIVDQFASYGFDFGALLGTDRVEIYLNTLEEQNRFVQRLVVFLQIPMMFLLSYLFKQKKVKQFIFFWLLLLFYYMVVAHTRYFTLFVLVSPLLLYHFHVKKISITKGAIICVVCVIFLTLANFVRNGAFQAGDTSQILSNPKVVIGQFEMDAPMESNYLIFQSINNGKMEIEFGKQYLYFMPISFIPRFLWNDKPIVSYFHRMTKIVTGRYPGKGQIILTSTILGEGFHEFGYFFIVLTPVLYIMVLFYYLKFLRRFQYAELFVLMVIFTIPMDIRGGFNSVLVSMVSSIIILLFFRHTFLFEKKPQKIKSNIPFF